MRYMSRFFSSNQFLYIFAALNQVMFFELTYLKFTPLRLFLLKQLNELVIVVLQLFILVHHLQNREHGDALHVEAAHLI